MPSAVLYPEQMREADRMTIEQKGISSLRLMESAGKALADALLARTDSVDGYWIYCGRGNNGGDALVVARLLALSGAKIKACFLLSGQPSPECQRQVELLESETDVQVSRSLVLGDEISPRDVIIDGLFGTGLNRSLEPKVIELIASLNLSPARRIAVDIPSGLNGVTGEAMPEAFKADLTLSLAAGKMGLFLKDGPSHVGDLEILDIGISPEVIDEVSSSPLNFYSLDEVLAWKSEKAPDDHKYSNGNLVSVTGSEKYPGAAVLSSLAAMRVGCGFVDVVAPESIQAILNNHILEAVVHASSIDRLEKAVELKRSNSTVIVGCGLGLDESIFDLVSGLIGHFDKGVLDADALNALATEPEKLKALNLDTWVLTPHLGELKRLMSALDEAGLEIPDLDRIHQLGWLAKTLGTTILLKGAPVIIASLDGEMSLFAGSSDFATAGTGDVLAGMIAGFLAQGMNPSKACLSSLALGRKSMFEFKKKYPYLSLVSSDLVANIWSD